VAEEGLAERPATLYRLKMKKATIKAALHSFYGAPGAIRTPDPLVRSQILYPTELRARCQKTKDQPLDWSVLV
jgi:hypothetical protein